MSKKEKLKLVLGLIITPILVGISIFIAIVFKDKPILQEKNNNGSSTQVLNVINHQHNLQK